VFVVVEGTGVVLVVLVDINFVVLSVDEFYIIFKPTFKALEEIIIYKQGANISCEYVRK
jgi:hypothetical protein